MPGFQQAPVFQLFDALESRLDGIAARADTAVAKIESVQAAAARAEQENSSSMERIAAAVDGAVSSSNGLAAVRDAWTATAASAASGAESIGRSATVARDATDRTREAVEGAVENQATALDDLIEKLLATETSYQETFLSIIEAGRAGLVSLDEIIRLFGQQEVVVDGQLQKLATVFRRINWRQWSQEIRDFADQVRQGAATLADVEAFLADKQNAVARRLLEIIQLFRQGKVSLQAVLDVARDIDRVFPGSDLDALADAIARALDDGTL